MYQLVFVALILSFILTGLLSYAFNLKLDSEQITLYVFVLFFVGIMIYFHKKYIGIELNSYLNNFIINGYVFLILFVVLCVCILIYVYGFKHANSYIIISGVLLVLFIFFCMYRIVDIMGSPLKKRNNRNKL